MVCQQCRRRPQNEAVEAGGGKDEIGEDYAAQWSKIENSVPKCVNIFQKIKITFHETNDINF